MKLTAILLIAACLQVSAKGYSQQVNISGKNLTLKQVFNEIQKQAGYTFFYSDKDLEKANLVNVHAKNADLTMVLNEVFTGQRLTYTIVDKTIVVKEKTAAEEAVAAQVDIRGRAINENGEPLPGITVSVKGSNLATATNDNGFFELKNVPANATLVFTGINIERYEVAVNGRSDLATLSLKTKVDPLSEVSIVVNTGYQTLSKERSAGSYAKPNLEILKDRSTSMNILQRLDGLVPGLTVNNSPSASQNPFLIRGLSTIGVQNGVNTGVYVATNRNPLYVVDGVPMDDLSSINPQDVADITVLRDATAASIWGSRASNGVIVIATRKGGNNEKIRVSYDGFVSLQGKPDLDYFPVLTSQQFIQAAKDVFDPVTNQWATVSGYTNIGSAGVPPHEMILYNQNRGIISPAQASKSLDSLASLSNRQQVSDLWYRNAALMNHTVSLTGGSKTHSFYGSLAYTNTQSARPGEAAKTFKANLRQDVVLNNRLQFYLITDLSNATTQAKRVINVDGRFYPYQLFRDETGNNLSVPYMGYLTDSTRLSYEARSRISLDYNPLNEFQSGYTKSDALLNRFIGGAMVKLLPGLRFEGVYSYIRGNNKTVSYDDEKSYLVRSELVQFTVAATPSATPAYYLPTTGGRYTVTNLLQRNWTVRNQLIFDYNWNNRKHQLTALAGQEAQEQLSTANRSTVRGYNELLQTYAPVDYAALGATGVASPVMPNNSNRSILSNDVFSHTETQTRFTSYYANAAYTFDRKYSVNSSWRIDQSNLFGLDKSAQNRPVWSIGAKWMLSDEPFLKNSIWMNRLALRATYGITGNSPTPGTASSYDILSPASSAFFPGNVGLRISSPANDKLTWESTKTLNLGLDFSLFGNLLNGSIDVYHKKTENLIGSVVVNSFSGYSTITGNFGNMQNRGVEISLSSTNIRNKNLVWQTILTGAYNKNTITQLNLGSPITTGQQQVSQRFMQGYPAFALFAYQFAGLDSLGDPQIYRQDKSVTKARNVTLPGDIAYMGTYQPVWSGGLSNILSYKGLTISINAVYNLGHVMRRDVNTFYQGRLTHSNLFSLSSGGGFSSGNLHAEFNDRWRKPGDEAYTQVPSYVSTVNGNNRRETQYYTRGDINVVSASFIKLRDITLSYSLPKSFNSRIKTENISFRVQVSNIMLWKANKFGIDPEFQDTFFGLRSLRANQGTITIGSHINF